MGIAKRLLGKVGVVKSTDRLRDSPAMLADHESAQMRKLYKITGQQQGPPPKYNFHFNPEHDLVINVHALATADSVEQRETAGLLDDPRSMVNRLNTLMTRMVQSK